ncbi:MAG: FprA family A-type flavoprotein [Clostridiales bacterium]|nr:FprA family A-type flavoprotein [Clostridiales bacterium]
MKLTDALAWCGVQDPGLRTFDIIMQTDYGTSYNAYLVQGEGKTALIETVKAEFCDLFFQRIEKYVPISSIDYLICNHTEPDHAGSVAKLLDANPGIQVVGTPTAIKFLRGIVNREFSAVPVKDGGKLDLGGKTLQFLTAPNLHWPDTMYTWLEEDGVLFTCDSFGAHYSYEPLLLSRMEERTDYRQAADYYYDMILKPFETPFMSKALDKIEPLSLSLICPGHGPVIDTEIPQAIAHYRSLFTPAPVGENKSVVIAYVSAYGYTRELAHMIAEGIEGTGNCSASLYDMETNTPQDVLRRIQSADGFLLGSPTILSDALEPIWALASRLNPVIHKGKAAAAFGAYGWSGEAVPNLTQRLAQLRFRTMDGLCVLFKPSQEDIAAARQFGADFVKLL